LVTSTVALMLVALSLTNATVPISHEVSPVSPHFGSTLMRSVPAVNVLLVLVTVSVKFALVAAVIIAATAPMTMRLKRMLFFMLRVSPRSWLLHLAATFSAFSWQFGGGPVKDRANSYCLSSPLGPLKWSLGPNYPLEIRMNAPNASL
jgi:hypothetical protein